MSRLASRLLSDTSPADIIGPINSPVNLGGGSVNEQVASVLTWAIQVMLLVAGLAALVFLLLGAFNWITSEGQKEKLEKAQRMMMNAVVGLLLVIVAFTVFSFFMGTVFGGKLGIGGDFSISIPRIGN